jgi:hypothetical protein
MAAPAKHASTTLSIFRFFDAIRSVTGVFILHMGGFQTLYDQGLRLISSCTDCSICRCLRCEYIPIIHHQVLCTGYRSKIGVAKLFRGFDDALILGLPKSERHWI